MQMPIPTPIGVGPRFHPPAVHARCDHPVPSRVHLELFAGGRVVLIPAHIGCWTRDPTGTLHFRGRPTLGDFFRAWRQRLAPTRLLSFAGRVRLYRNGSRLLVDPRAVPLRDGDELVLEVGRFVPPHSIYLFPPQH
jgi:hypothetical protein